MNLLLCLTFSQHMIGTGLYEQNELSLGCHSFHRLFQTAPLCFFLFNVRRGFKVFIEYLLKLSWLLIHRSFLTIILRNVSFCT